MTGRLQVGADISESLTLKADVCVVGSGAGGAVLAARLATAGVDVVMLEEGGHFTRRDFKMEEGHAYSTFYQDAAGRATADLAISIFQGRTVGGGTTVNWTTCFRTPDSVLKYWRETLGIEDWQPGLLTPHFEAVEKRLNIQPWPEASANQNNRILLDGAKSLGWHVKPLRRNVKSCANTGYCGLGCPVDAKQAMHLTYIPDALEQGLRLFADVRVERIVTENGRAKRVEARVMDRATCRPTQTTVSVDAKVIVSSCGAINGPALLLRSGINPNGRVGLGTFLHPVVALPGLYEREINGFYGAPQSIGSHEFIDRGPGKVGFFLEVPPLQPMLASMGAVLFGKEQQDFMSQLPRVGALLAISHDGMSAGDEGGRVSLRGDGRIRLDYPIGEPLKEAFKEGHKVMARAALAAGAIMTSSSHADPIIVKKAADIAAYDTAPYGALKHTIFSAHQMGGCAMGPDPATSVVNPKLQHHHIPNLFVVDGSIFPTALGVNPSETIYSFAHRASAWVAEAV